MIDREKVIRALEICVDKDFWVNCEDCPYCPNCEDLERDALALLKAQEPKVLTREEIQQSLHNGDTAFLLEVEGRLLIWTLYMAYNERTRCIVLRDDTDDVHVLHIEDYGATWRCWTSRPTDAQWEATPWIKQ